MGKKLFLSDLDGTLLTDEKRISEKTMEALQEFVGNGNAFAICTGRALESALTVHRELKLDFDNSYVAAYNGGQIYDPRKKETIYRIGIPLPITEDIFAIAKECGIHVHTYNDNYIITQDYGECMGFYRRVIKTPAIVTEHPMAELSEPPCKMIAIELKDHEKQEVFHRKVAEKYKDELSLMYSNAYYLEIILKESGKGNAVRQLAAYLGISMEDTIAAGDADNDISMIEAAGLGIAMSNAADSVKGRADIITQKDNNQDGLVPFIME